jgi:FkbM family methyltransferase
MMDQVYRDAVVWDVGANVGYYTARFSAAVGEGGEVVAIEPNPSSLVALRRNLNGLGNVVVVRAALADSEVVMGFDPGADAESPMARLVGNGGGGDGRLDVLVTTGDNLLKSGKVRHPNLVKIDTEGYELDVLNGMKTVLGHPALKAVCVEVHFRLLAERGAGSAPAEIEALLAEAGLSVEWTDLSHLIALRRPLGQARRTV